MATYTFVTIYTPPKGMVVVHSWGPYEARRDAISAAAKMRRRHQRDNAWMSKERAAIENKRLTFHIQEVSDPFEVRERIEGQMVITERSIPDLTPLKNAQSVVLAAAINWVADNTEQLDSVNPGAWADDADFALIDAVRALKAL